MIPSFLKTKRKGAWQNLVHGKCPYDDSRLLREKKIFACPTCDWYITPARLVRFITDRNSLTWKNMTEHERLLVERAMQEPATA